MGSRVEGDVIPATLVLWVSLVDMALAVLLVREMLFGSLVVVNMALLVLVLSEDSVLLDMALELEVPLGLLLVDIDMVIALLLTVGVQSRGKPWVLC